MTVDQAQLNAFFRGSAPLGLARRAVRRHQLRRPGQTSAAPVTSIGLVTPAPTPTDSSTTVGADCIAKSAACFDRWIAIRSW
ncbi:MAG: hypothetical protein ABI137_04455 [Antricoccus sp.]